MTSDKYSQPRSTWARVALQLQRYYQPPLEYRTRRRRIALLGVALLMVQVICCCCPLPITFRTASAVLAQRSPDNASRYAVVLVRR